MNEKQVIEGYLISTKEYPSKTDNTRLGGLALRIKTDPFEENPAKDIWATLWMNNEKNWSLYLRHKAIYDNIKSANPTDFKVKIIYHPAKDPRYKEVDDIEFLNLNEPPKKEFTGFTQKDINEVVEKAKTEAKNLTPIPDKPAPHDSKFTPANKLEEKPMPKDDYYQRKSSENEGKVRHGVVVAFIEVGAIKLDDDNVFDLGDLQKKRINSIVRFIMEGK